MKIWELEITWKDYLFMGSVILFILLIFCSYLFGPSVKSNEYSDESCLPNYMAGCDN
jgi:hypothetical protein